MFQLRMRSLSVEGISMMAGQAVHQTSRVNTELLCCAIVSAHSPAAFLVASASA